jgi:hypothetical protein
MRAGAYHRPRANGSALRVLLYLGLMVVLTVAAFLGVFGDLHLDAPDADQQLKTETACLHGAGFDVKSDVPEFGRSLAPTWEVEVLAKGADHEHLAFVFLFDDADTANLYFERSKTDAEDDPPPKGVKIEQRGTEVLRLYADAAQEAVIRGCVDKAIKPPPHKK